MLISMTGFGRAVRDSQAGQLIVEIQSLNRKYLEIFVSLPRELSRFEMDLRKWVSEEILRGQVSIRVFLKASEQSIERSLPNITLLKRLKKDWVKIAKGIGCDDQDVNLPFLLDHLPDLFDPETGQKTLSALHECVNEALDGVVMMKQKEGLALSTDIGLRLKTLEGLVQKIEKISPDAVAKQRQKLSERMTEVFQPSADLDERLLREIAIFAERIDITEEITRFRSHTLQFREMIHAKAGSVGRKLDFLVQEMGREINTMGSKSSDAAISRLIVDAKSELEKVREQIQNIE